MASDGRTSLIGMVAGYAILLKLDQLTSGPIPVIFLNPVPCSVCGGAAESAYLKSGDKVVAGIFEVNGTNLK